MTHACSITLFVSTVEPLFLSNGPISCRRVPSQKHCCLVLNTSSDSKNDAASAGSVTHTGLLPGLDRTLTCARARAVLAPLLPQWDLSLRERQRRRRYWPCGFRSSQARRQLICEEFPHVLCFFKHWRATSCHWF